MQYGIIEGFYGKPWGFGVREAMIPFMKQYGYSFYLYAPKSDPYLREQWDQPVPEILNQKLKSMGQQFRQNQIDWGVGLSPFEVYKDFNAQTLSRIKNKVIQLQDLGINWLAILFDDMSGLHDDLAKIQLEICHFIQDEVQLDRLLMCPSYYCFDPILESVFGKMPDNYFEELAEGLDANIDIFWTGEKVCSTAYSTQHLQQVTRLFNRKPFIWDNYPVNDGARMSPFLHLSAFTGRENCSDETVAGLAVNPMNEAWLSQIPMATLADCLSASSTEGPAYQADKSFEKQVKSLLGSSLAKTLKKDLHLFEKDGFNNIPEGKRAGLVEKYLSLRDTKNENYVDELISYLHGEYLSDVKDEVPTQLLWQD